MAVSAFDVLASFFGFWNSGDVSILARQRFAPATPDSYFQSFPSLMAGVIIAADDGVQKRAQDSHAALD